MSIKRRATLMVYILLLPVVVLLLYSDIISLKDYFITGVWNPTYSYELPSFNNMAVVFIKDVVYLLSGFCYFILKKDRWRWIVIFSIFIIILHCTWQIFLFIYEDPI